MQCERNRDVQIFLDPPVIVRVEVSEPAVLVERILLDVDARRVEMRAENIQALLERLRSDLKEHDGLIHPDRIDFVARLQRSAGPNELGKLPEAVHFRLVHDRVNALSLRFGDVQKCFILLGELHCRFFLLSGVGSPYISSVHIITP